MKYYLVKIQKNADGVTQGVYAYDSYDAALVEFHSELAYRNVNRISTVCVIIDERGNTVKKETYGATGE